VETNFPISHFSPEATEATVICANSFQANWEMLPEATTYILSVYQKVNDDDDFEIDNFIHNYVLGYEALDVGNVLSHTVEGLEKETQYYYTVVASDGILFSKSSNEISVTTTDGTNDICNTPIKKSMVFVDNENIIILSNSEMNLAIYNIAGQLLLSKTITEGEWRVSKNYFSVGVYFVKLGIDTHKILVR